MEPNQCHAGATCTATRAPRILVVDDEEQTVLSLGIVLASAGYSVSEAGSGGEALAEISRLAAEDPVDLVLLDLQMPGMDGLTFIDRLAALGLAIPVVVMTGYGDRQTLEQLTRRGCRQPLLKPFRPERALAMVAQGLARAAVAGAQGAIDLPADPSIPGLAVRVWPYAEICGDWISVHPLPDGVAVVMADIAGFEAREQFHALMERTIAARLGDLARAPARLLEDLNRQLLLGDGPVRLATAMVVVVGIRPPCCRLVLAGPPPLLVLRGDGSSSWAGTPGPPLGVTRTPGWTAEDLLLAGDDRLVLTSDGIAEAARREAGSGVLERLGMDGIASYARLQRGLPTGQAADALMAAALGHCRNKPSDDLVLALFDLAGLARGRQP